MAMHLNDRMFETHLSTPISQTFALIAGDCNTTESYLRMPYADLAHAVRLYSSRIRGVRLYAVRNCMPYGYCVDPVRVGNERSCFQREKSCSVY
jgi:hypothetical protein